MDRLAVLIPCYNEAGTIQKVVSDFRISCPDAVIYVYDNNSTDGTADAARRAGAIVRNEYRQGKGNVIRRMFREVNALCYILVDGDDTYPAECAPDMAKLVYERNADMVIGDRLSSTYFTENKRPFHNFGNVLMRNCINYLFKSDISDIMTGYRAFSYEFVKTFPVLSKGFEIETEMTIHAVDKHLYIENYVVEYRDRPKGSTSKLNTVFIIYTGLIALFSVIFKTWRKRDFAVYGVLSLFPALWFAVVKSHSYSHYWFTHKNLIVFCFALMLMFSSNFTLNAQNSFRQKKKKNTIR